MTFTQSGEEREEKEREGKSKRVCDRKGEGWREGERERKGESEEKRKMSEGR